MSEKKMELTRRKILAGLGTIGVASAGVGIGTSAYFSDTETFTNNRLVAGELDLKVDWQEHYYDGAAPGAEPADVEEADYVLPALEPAQELENGDYTGVDPAQIAAPEDALPIALDFTEDKDAFWEATSIEAYPDVDDDGIQDDFDTTYTIGETDVTVGPICEAGADTPEDLHPEMGKALRTNNEDTVIIENEEIVGYKPLVSLDDVKPGDFGELTLSFHLCDNPGYVWLTGELLENDENSVTEPEGKDPDESQDADDPDDEFDGELVDHVLTRMWYDEDCDNQVDEEAGDLDLMLAIDTSGSIRGDEQDQMRDGVNAFIDDLPDDGSVQVGTLTFGDNDVANLQGLDTPDNVSVTLSSFGGNTPLPAALDIADQAVRNLPNARSGAQKTVVVFTDGGPNYENQIYSANSYDGPRSADWSADDADQAYDNGTQDSSVDVDEMDETAMVADMVRGQTTRVATVFVGEENSTDAMTQPAIDKYDTLPDYLGDEIASPGFSFTVDLTDLDALATQLVESIVIGEEVFFLGTLRNALDVLADGNGIPLDGDLETPYNELGDPPEDEDRECFEASTTNCIGLEWWLPLNHANQIQSDSVAFDLGFYTEQCRHNDGAGMEPESAD